MRRCLYPSPARDNTRMFQTGPDSTARADTAWSSCARESQKAKDPSAWQLRFFIECRRPDCFQKQSKCRLKVMRQNRHIKPEIIVGNHRPHVTAINFQLTVKLVDILTAPQHQRCHQPGNPAFFLPSSSFPPGKKSPISMTGLW